MLLAARAAGVATVLVGVTDGEASHRAGGPALVRRRAGERTEALRRLGLGAVPVERLGLPDGAVGDHRRDLADRLGALVRPGDVWVAPWSGDGHPDHDAAGAVAASVGAAAGVDVLAYLVWTWHWAVPDDPGLPWAAARRIDLGRRAAAAKRWATAAFGSQVRPGPDGGGPVLPDAVLRRSWRRHETYLVAGPDPGPVPG
jgi:LmbE family N-acetylglucosaminyl deacetylase